ncbi:MAG: DUF2007 domain-containing protein [Chitinophagales bacterium]
MNSSWVKIYSTSQAHLAEIAKGVLKESGIDSVVLNKKDSAYNMWGEVELYASEKNAREAMSIIKQHDL